jgi:hypothetical protein
MHLKSCSQFKDDELMAMIIRALKSGVQSIMPEFGAVYCLQSKKLTPV